MDPVSNPVLVLLLVSVLNDFVSLAAHSVAKNVFPSKELEHFD